MTFIKIENIVINTSYIAAVSWKARLALEKEAFLSATPKFPTVKATYPIPYHYEWLDFTGGSYGTTRLFQ